MSTIDQILTEISGLSEEDQETLVRRLNRTVLAKRFFDRGHGSDAPLPVSDQELDRIVHEARSEALREHGF